MANQNDNPTVADLDLSGIEGFGDGTLVDESPITAPEDDAPVEAPEEVTLEDASSTVDDGPISWASMEKLIPEPLHEDLKPVVEEWRRQYERVLDETMPYRQYSEKGISAHDMELAINIQQALLQDPKRFYDGLGETYGWNQQPQQPAPTLAQQYAAMGQAQPKPAAPASEWDSFFGEDATPEQQAAMAADPRLLAAIEAQQARLDQLEQMQQQAVQAQQQAQIEAVGRQQLEGELAGLEAKYGKFDRAEVVKRAIANASAGQDPSVAKAFHELKDYEDRLRKQFVSARPPKVMGSGTGIQPPVPTDLSTEDAKREAALALAIRLGADSPTSYQR
jgi:hypothetical protein